MAHRIDDVRYKDCGVFFGFGADRGPARRLALTVGSRRERFVLVSLLLNADRPVPADALIDALWTEPPASARAQLHNMLSNLRRRLAAGEDDDVLIVSRPFGYELRLGTHELDLLEFPRLAAGGRQAPDDGDHASAWAMLGDALALWRGPALADVPDGLVAGVRQGARSCRRARAAPPW